ncbi:MAG: hypothetical protein MUE40_02355 [Anaerolineae bacterium]|nr:hypothetical protein [Anaerolineae bacterium]
MGRRRIVGLLVALLLVLLAMAPGSGGRALAQDGAVIGGDDAALRTYLARLARAVGGPLSVSVYVAQLPPELPFALPLPPAVRLVGSITRPSSEGRTFYEIALDGSTPGDVMTFYRDALTAAGWTVIQSDATTSGGFDPTASAFGSFCLNNTEANITLDAFAAGTQTNIITLNVQIPADSFQCQAVIAPITVDPYRLIPMLALPPGVALQNNTSGLSFYTPEAPVASAPATLSSERPLAEIAADYNLQLQAAGWTQVSAEAGGTFALSLWTLPDTEGGTWQGRFLLMAAGTPGQYHALLYIQQ